MIKLISVALFLSLSVAPIFADSDFTLTKNIKKKTEDRTVFNLLQFSGVMLTNVDNMVTYYSLWYSNGRILEANPFWRSIHHKPALVFVTFQIVNLGIIAGSNWLYKRSKFLAYIFIIAVNIIEIYCVYGHLRLQKKIGI